MSERKPGRNDPCPCGSGKKFKVCCAGSRAVDSWVEARARWSHLSDLQELRGSLESEAKRELEASVRRVVDPDAVGGVLGVASICAEPPPLLTLAVDEFAKLDLADRFTVYWGELDTTFWWVRSRTRNLMGALLRRLLAHPDPADAPLLRQLVELAIWSAFYSWAVTWSYNVLCRSFLDAKQQFAVLQCADLENFVRGAVAEGDRRLTAGRLAAGEAVQRADPATVAEISATFAKQRTALRLMLEMRARTRTEAQRIEPHLDVLEDAYDYLCGLTHVTPILILGNESERYRKVFASVCAHLPAFMMNTAWQPDLLGLSFLERLWPFFDPTAKNMASPPFPQLAQLAKNNDSVHIELRDSEPLVIGPSRKKAKT